MANSIHNKINFIYEYLLNGNIISNEMISNSNFRRGTRIVWQAAAHVAHRHSHKYKKKTKKKWSLVCTTNVKFISLKRTYNVREYIRMINTYLYRSEKNHSDKELRTYFCFDIFYFKNWQFISIFWNCSFVSSSYWMCI